MENLTWRQLKDFCQTIEEEFLDEEVVAQDETSVHKFDDVSAMKENHYANKDDYEDNGSLDELKAIHEDEFDESEYEMVAKKGHPFLYVKF